MPRPAPRRRSRRHCACLACTADPTPRTTICCCSPSRYQPLWHPRVIQLSALSGQGVAEFWRLVSEFRHLQQANGRWQARRQQQAKAWMWERIDSGLREAFAQHPAVQDRLPALTAEVLAGRVVASVAARQLLQAFAIPGVTDTGARAC